VSSPVWMSISGPWAFFGGSPGAGELVVIFLVILILFGPKRLPEIARTIGKMMTQLRRASNDFRDQIMEIDKPHVHDIAPEPDEHPDGEQETPATGAAAPKAGGSGDTEQQEKA
jgi:Tat protein translocase TatB subunit